jgi:hypothetical protein
MKKEMTLFTIVCDRCGKDALANEDFSCLFELSDVREIAGDSGWINIIDNDYCNNCWQWDESEDNQIPKP